MGTTEPAQIAALPNEDQIIRVTNSANARDLAVVISHAIYDNHKPILRAIGAGAVNQALKACIIARGYVATRGVDLVVRPGFSEVPGDGENGKVSAITLLVLAT